MRRELGWLLVGALFAAPVGAQAGDKDKEKEKDKGKPRLDLRATPRFGFSPVTISFTAELVGGADVEEFNCPNLVWEWDDGGKSEQESDCAPLSEGGTIERRFTNSHDYKRAGTYNVKVTMRRANRPLAQATARVTVRAGMRDPSLDRGGDPDGE